MSTSSSSALPGRQWPRDDRRVELGQITRAAEVHLMRDVAGDAGEHAAIDFFIESTPLMRRPPSRKRDGLLKRMAP
jgi:hypothetical protein